jgi:DNA polymerase I-like protein with 3'-5' exonuclease and polymerase domains
MSVIKSDEFTYALKPLCKKYFSIEADDEDDLHKSTVSARRLAKKSGWAIADAVEADYWLGDPAACLKYGLRDALRVVYLRKAHMQHFQENSDALRVYDREMELMATLERMECRGVAIDESRNTELRKFYEKIASESWAGVCAAGGANLNLASPKQMTMEFFGMREHSPLLYSTNKKKGNIPVACQHCKGSGCLVCQDTGQNPKCDGEFLAHIGVKHEQDDAGQDKLVMGDPLAWHILHHSAASSMLRFVEQYKDLAVVEADTDCRIIHPNYRQTGARTARMSAERPNLQNVASDDSGKKKVDVPYRPREIFVPRPGTLFHVPDYSQIEVWILALLSKDKELIAALTAGGDAHQNVADLIWGHTYDRACAKRDAEKDPLKLSPAALANLKRYKTGRKRAKNLQFCKIYGGGAKKIASMIKTSVDEAKTFISDYDLRLPAVKRYMDESIAIAKAKGEVVNPFGRVYSVDPGYEYRATNYLIQGTAAEVMKNAMSRLDKLYAEKWDDKARLLLQIHDELIIEVDRNADCEQLRKDTVRAMGLDALTLGSPVPFPVGYKITEERWSQCMDVVVAA